MSNRTTDWVKIYHSQLSVPDALAIELERLITSGEILIGSRIPPERELADLWGLSRSSVRDALRQLALRGLVERRPGRGTLVVDHANHLGGSLTELLNESQRELAQVMELRMVIEPSATAIAAERARPSDLEELSGLLDEMSEDVNAQRFTELDESFHRLIVRATGNPLLVSLLERVAEMIDLSRSELFQRPSRRETSLSEHAQILKALYSRDPELAGRAARAHLESVRHRIASIDRESAIKNPS